MKTRKHIFSFALVTSLSLYNFALADSANGYLVPMIRLAPLNQART
ncbi:hypothetical protein [Helicobacter gastrocanis]|nr:hypothetical protein [Helicobacter sp. NHP19-003]